MPDENSRSQSGPHALGAPDPSLATIAQLDKLEINLEKLFIRDLEGVRKVLQTQIDAAKEAVAAQTRSSGDAISKAERATEKALDQMQNALSTAMVGITGQINDAKDRIGKIEAIKIGQGEQRQTQQVSIGQWIAIAGLVAATIFGGIGAIALLRDQNSNAPIIIERAAPSERLSRTTTTTESP